MELGRGVLRHDGCTCYVCATVGVTNASDHLRCLPRYHWRPRCHRRSSSNASFYTPARIPPRDPALQSEGKHIHVPRSARRPVSRKWEPRDPPWRPETSRTGPLNLVSKRAIGPTTGSPLFCSSTSSMLLYLSCGLLAAVAVAAYPDPGTVTGDTTGVHDPSVAKTPSGTC